ncbi:MAG TPA: PQQ-binding-like beta-propeller repeat protein [Vicinamibacterales bacterium]|jgi:outer membrane protein assembly factor BamB|nr:PQQ-binding-like beta-propeller repeat protein [Vicinamibacterales bacterium]
MRRRVVVNGACVLGVLVSGLSVFAHDWPQFLGPQRNGVYSGPPLATSWPAGGPKRVWRKNVGQGFAGPAVAGDRVVLFHRVANEEVVEALDARTGNPRWRFAYTTTYRDDFGFDEGPRAVPVVVQGRVYTFGAEGQLHALDLAEGKRIWSVDTARRFGVPKGFFGAAGSPLVEDGRVIANIGGQDGGKAAGIVAFDAATGAILWTATNHQAGYSSGVGATFGGKRTAVFFTRQGLVGLDPASGGILFQKTWRSRSAASVNAASPLIVGDRIFISASYETGAALLRVQGNTLAEIWSQDEAMSNHYATSVARNGILYGFHGRQEFNPSFRAVELDTGKVRWSMDRFHAGTVTLAGDTLLILRETGELMLAPASPDGFRPLAQAQILPATVRANPALADGFLFVRNSDTRANELVCLDLRP